MTDKKTFDAVEMMRSIRTARMRELIDLPPSERLRIMHERAVGDRLWQRLAQEQDTSRHDNALPRST